jgi:hypothetical protein
MGSSNTLYSFIFRASSRVQIFHLNAISSRRALQWYGPFHAAPHIIAWREFCRPRWCNHKHLPGWCRHFIFMRLAQECRALDLARQPLPFRMQGDRLRPDRE